MNLGKRIKVALDRSGMKAPEACRAANVPLPSINALMRRDSKRSEFTDALLSVIPDGVINKEWVRTGRGTPDDGIVTRSPRLANVTPIHNAASSKEPPRAAHPQTARSAHVELSDSLVGSSPIRTWEHQDELPPGVEVFVPRLAVFQAHEGAGIEGVKVVLLTDEVQAFRSDWIRDDQLKPAGLAWARIEDDSMEPVIYKGELYVIDTTDTTVIDARTFSVYYDGIERARKCFRLPGGGLRLVASNSATFPALDLTAEQAKAVKIIGRVRHRAGNGGL